MLLISPFSKKYTIWNQIVVLLSIKGTKPILHLAMYFSALILFSYSFITVGHFAPTVLLCWWRQWGLLLLFCYYCLWSKLSSGAPCVARKKNLPLLSISRRSHWGVSHAMISVLAMCSPPCVHFNPPALRPPCDLCTGVRQQEPPKTPWTPQILGHVMCTGTELLSCISIAGAVRNKALCAQNLISSGGLGFAHYSLAPYEISVLGCWTISG